MNKKLTAIEAQVIIDRVASGETQKSIAIEYGITISTVSSIITGRTWPDLNRPEIRVRVRGTKLTPEDVVTIYQRIDRHESLEAIATDYGVTRQTIANIKRRTTWSHIRKTPATQQRRKVWEDV